MLVYVFVFFRLCMCLMLSCGGFSPTGDKEKVCLIN